MGQNNQGKKTIGWFSRLLGRSSMNDLLMDGDDKERSALEHPHARNRKMRPPELQQLWFSTLRYPWSTLVVVPTHRGGSAYPVAEALAEVGNLQESVPVRLIDAEGIELKESTLLTKSIASHVESGGKAVVAVEPVVQSLAAIPLARGADAVLLSVSLQTADIASAKRTVELIGSERIIGTVALHLEKHR